MAPLTALAQLPDPQSVTQAGASLGQLHGHGLAAGQRHRSGSEFLLGPLLAGEFVVRQAGDALGLHALEKLR